MQVKIDKRSLLSPIPMDGCTYRSNWIVSRWLSARLVSSLITHWSYCSLAFSHIFVPTCLGRVWGINIQFSICFVAFCIQELVHTSGPWKHSTWWSTATHVNTHTKRQFSHLWQPVPNDVNSDWEQSTKTVMPHSVDDGHIWCHSIKNMAIFLVF